MAKVTGAICNSVVVNAAVITGWPLSFVRATITPLNNLWGLILRKLHTSPAKGPNEVGVRFRLSYLLRVKELLIIV
jgi:hypothetical protein